MLLSQGRAPGVCVVGAVQDPRKDVLSLRYLFPTRIALRCTDRIQPDLVLGEGARALGARADRISADTPGVAYVMSDGDVAPLRVRTAWVDDQQIEELAAHATPPSAVGGPGIP
jgi:DNA segregation ATPase FtsK/SpoIIIE, S-DNA-T family